MSDVVAETFELIDRLGLIGFLYLLTNVQTQTSGNQSNYIKFHGF